MASDLVLLVQESTFALSIGLLLLLVVFMAIFHTRSIRTQQQLHDELLDVLQASTVNQAPTVKAVEEWHDVDDDTQIPSVVFRPNNRHPVPHLLLLVIPGNPGIPAFYIPFLRSLFERFNARVEARCLGYAGHYLPHKNGDRIFDLAQHVRHQRAYIRQRVQEDPALHLIVIGHSIGSYLALQLVDAFPDHIAKIVLMMPTIHHIAASDKGHSIRWLLEHPKFVHNVIQAVETVCPLFIRRWLVRLSIGMHQDIEYQLAALLLVHAPSLHNVVHTAGQEMRSVLDVDAELVHAHESDTLFVYSPVDGWVPHAFMQSFQLWFDKAQHRIVPQHHAFMMDQHGVRDMADHVMAWIHKIVPIENGKSCVADHNGAL